MRHEALKRGPCANLLGLECGTWMPCQSLTNRGAERVPVASAAWMLHQRQSMGSRGARVLRHRVRRAVVPESTADPRESAATAGLRYVTDRAPGIHRVRAGSGFRYVTPGGSTLRDTKELARIRALVIPPAWRDVWICSNPLGHRQATGRDARGRKQHRYHPRWRRARDEVKYGRMLEFAASLPGLRARVARDVSTPGL